MELIFTAVLLSMVLLVYFSDRKNPVNKWCAAALFIFWLGVAKEAVLFNIIPMLEDTFKGFALADAFMPVYSIFTWSLYNLATPTALIYALYVYGLDKRNPALLKKLRFLVYLPALVCSFCFTPLAFRAFQVGGLADGLHSPFWITYSIYNFIYVASVTYFLISNALKSKNMDSRIQKTLALAIILPCLLYWWFTVFPTHTLGIESQFKLWQGNVIVITVSITIFIAMSFKYGVMGLKLQQETYRWNSDMAITSRGAEYTGHMIKNQAAKMEWSIRNLNAWFKEHNQEVPEELAILSHSVSSFKEYAGKMKKLSDEIVLTEELCNLEELIKNALPAAAVHAQVNIAPLANTALLCDRAHMSEVFANIMTNALEACTTGCENGYINISAEPGKDFYRIRFMDNGAGMGEDVLKKIFDPYYTTKHTDSNFGLGLAYCKNVVKKHGGEIFAESTLGKGTTFTVALPTKRINPTDRTADKHG